MGKKQNIAPYQKGRSNNMAVKERSNKKGLSQIVSTVLLIAIVITIIAIIFVWSRGFIQESVQKKGLPAEQACSEVEIDMGGCSDDILQITNIGNTPIYQFGVIETTQNGGGSDSTIYNMGAGIGESISIELANGCPEKVEVFPYILGTSGDAKKAYACLNRVFE